MQPLAPLVHSRLICPLGQTSRLLAIRKVAWLRPGVRPAVPFEILPTRQVVIADGPHPPVELVTVAATVERGWFSPAVPSACP